MRLQVLFWVVRLASANCLNLGWKVYVIANGWRMKLKGLVINMFNACSARMIKNILFFSFKSFFIRAALLVEDITSSKTFMFFFPDTSNYLICTRAPKKHACSFRPFPRLPHTSNCTLVRVIVTAPAIYSNIWS